VCGASTANEWVWTGRLQDVGCATPPASVPGLLIVGEVVRVRETIVAARSSKDIDGFANSRRDESSNQPIKSVSS
jgi:hypothetical protein